MNEITNTTQAAIVLLLISQKDNAFRNGYSLNKYLSRRFGIIDLVGISKLLSEKGLINILVIKQIGQYSLTNEGETWLRQSGQHIADLYREYPEQSAFLDMLVENSSQKLTLH